MKNGIKDKSWAALPKELRKRVKDVYKVAKQRYEYPTCDEDKINGIGAMQALEALFDEHNLNYNTELRGKNTIDCDKEQVLSFYEHLLDLVEKERMSKNYSEWCELEREYIAMISEKHFTEHFKIMETKECRECGRGDITKENHDIDWEQRRYELAMNFTAALLKRLNYDPFTVNVCCCCSDGEPVNPYSNIARIAVSAADAVIEELKKPKNQEKRKL